MNFIIKLINAPELGSILGIAGLFAALFFYLRSRRISQLAYQLEEFTMIGGSNAEFPNEVEIRFANRRVNRVTVSRIVLWNSGNMTINGSQVVDSDPVRLELTKEGEILKVDVLRHSRASNMVRIIPRNGSLNIVDIPFDYFDPKDGISLEVIHSSTKNSIKCMGTIRGIPKGISNYGKLIFQNNRKSNYPFARFSVLRKLFQIFMAAVGGAIIFVGLYEPQWFALADRSDADMPSWLFVVVGLLYFIPPVVLLWIRRRRYPQTLEPDSENNDAKQ